MSKVPIRRTRWHVAFCLIFFHLVTILTALPLHAKDENIHLLKAQKLYDVMLESPDDKKMEIRALIRKEMEQYTADNSVSLRSYSLPFKHGHWKVTQGNTTKYSHKNKNQFSWDFELVDNQQEYHFQGLKKRVDPKENYSYGMPIYAVESGKVWLRRHNKDGKGKSNIIVIKHGNGSRSIYDHVRPYGFNVEKGDQVRKGELIGYVGFSGTSYPHIHFSIRNSKLDNRTAPIKFKKYYLLKYDQINSKRISEITDGVPKKSQVIAATLCEAENPSIP
jgi:hypothetical protein